MPIWNVEKAKEQGQKAVEYFEELRRKVIANPDDGDSGYLLVKLKRVLVHVATTCKSNGSVEVANIYVSCYKKMVYTDITFKKKSLSSEYQFSR